MEMITDNTSLAQACARFSGSSYITIDTEFHREATFWPRLCLLQVAMPGYAVLIDPLSEGLDLAPFYKLLQQETLVKVMHGCRQDIEIFYHEAGIIPAPLMDTQIMAMVCGFGDSVGYETLVRQTVDVAIDKGSRFTNWSQRPLSEAQLAYALDDVTHLRDIYEKLAQQIERSGRQDWIKEEMAHLQNPQTYDQIPENAWKRIRMQDQRPHVMSALIALCEWREKKAQSRNVPRNRIFRDEAIREIATQSPKDIDAFDRLRSVPRGFSRSRTARELLDVVRKAREMKKEDLPVLPPATKKRPGIAPLVELLKVLLKYSCEKHEVAPKLVANNADLEHIAGDENPQVKALQGWRYDVFGANAMRLKKGEIGIACEDDKIILIPRS